MPREIKARLAEEQAKEQKLLASLRRKTVTGESLFRESFSGTPIAPVARKTRAFYELLHERDRRDFHRETTPQLRFGVALTRLLERSSDWKRPIETWTPRGKSGHTVLHSLLYHLFCLYPTPTFLLTHWAKDDMVEVPNRGYNRMWTLDPTVEIGRKILVSVGGGESFAKKVLTKAYKCSKSDLSFPPVTKRQSHLFLTMTGNLSLMEALRHAQTKSFGGAWLLGQELAAALANIQPDEEFTAQIIQWFCGQGMFNLAMVRPMIDYIRHSRQANAQWGIVGRTVASLLEGMEIWHKELQQQKVGPRKQWDACGLPKYEHGEWTCVELCTASALHQEGRAMHHCVSSYIGQAAEGKVSIWSLRKGDERRLTVEVRQRQIAQARGVCNERPKWLDLEHLRRWAEQAKLTIGTHL